MTTKTPVVSHIGGVPTLAGIPVFPISPPGFIIDEAVKAVHNSLRTENTWASHSQKVRRFLDKLVQMGELSFFPGQQGGSDGGVPARWALPGAIFNPGDGAGLGGK